MNHDDETFVHYFVERVRDFEDGSTIPVSDLGWVAGDYYSLYGRTDRGYAYAIEDFEDYQDAKAALQNSLARLELDREYGYVDAI
jgi:hypothetical protein